MGKMGVVSRSLAEVVPVTPRDMSACIFEKSFLTYRYLRSETSPACPGTTGLGDFSGERILQQSLKNICECFRFLLQKPGSLKYSCFLSFNSAAPFSLLRSTMPRGNSLTVPTSKQATFQLSLLKS